MAFTLLFVVVLTLGVLTRLWLASRQIRHVARHRDAVPGVFAHRISLTSHQRAADYTVARARLGMIETVVDAAVLIGLTLMGGLQWLAEWSYTLPGGDIVRQLAFIAAVMAVTSAVSLPFTLWRQFRLEARFGFNRMTFGLFVADALKGLVIGAVLGLPLVAVILWLMQGAGDTWWFWAWLVWAAFNLAVLWLFPTVIAPLFNKFSPLTDAELTARIDALARRCGFSLNGLFVMDGSRRSAHGNAYFTGFGKAKRIVFFDTLLSRLNADEIEAVLAHELGHFRHRHILRRIVLSFGLSLAFLALLGWLSQRAWFYTGLGVTPNLIGPSDALALVLFMLVMPVFTFLFTPIASWYSRRDEFQADSFAAEQTDSSRLVSALVKLYDDNAATLTPDPRHSAFYDSHPPAAVRIGRLTGSTT
jgi:STE24 endopeptidase